MGKFNPRSSSNILWDFIHFARDKEYLIIWKCDTRLSDDDTMISVKKNYRVSVSCHLLTFGNTCK